jgi:hypothetical protein
MQPIHPVPSGVLLGALLAVACPLHAEQAHVHGYATLDVAVDGNTLALRLESPLDSFVGFERAPKNEKERAAVRRMAQALRSEQAFLPSAAAACRLKDVALSSPVLDPALLLPAAQGQPPAQPAAEAGHKGHAEILADYTYECATPAALRGLEVGLFKSFKGLKRLDVQVAAPQGQTSARLTAKKAALAW